MNNKEIYNNKILYGMVTEDIFLVTRKPTDFVLRFSGFGISTKMLALAKESGAKKVQIFFLNDKKHELYECPILQYLQSPVTFTYNSPEEENDTRAFVKTCDMTKIKEYSKDTDVDQLAGVERMDTIEKETTKVEPLMEAPRVLKKWNDVAINNTTTTVNTQEMKGGRM